MAAWAFCLAIQGMHLVLASMNKEARNYNLTVAHIWAAAGLLALLIGAK